MRDFYGDPRQHERLMRVLTRGSAMRWPRWPSRPRSTSPHGASTTLALDAIEPGLAVALTQPHAMAAIDADMQRVVDAARDTLAQAGVAADAVDALYLTGGSTGLAALAQRLAAVCPPRRWFAATASPASPKDSGCTRSGCSR